MPKTAVPLHRVFHSIRFKVNKIGVQRYPIFFVPIWKWGNKMREGFYGSSGRSRRFRRVRKEPEGNGGSGRSRRVQRFRRFRRETERQQGQHFGMCARPIMLPNGRGFKRKSYTLHQILHQILHPKQVIDIGIFRMWCRKCRFFPKTFLERFSPLMHLKPFYAHIALRCCRSDKEYRGRNAL